MEDKQPVTRADVTLAEVASVIARAADLATGQPLDHVVRSCAIASLFAEHLGIAPDERTATYWVSLLMISGCSAVSFEMSQLFGDDIELRAGGYQLGPSQIEMARYVFGRAGGDAPLGTKTRVRLQLLGTRLRPFIETVLAHCSVNARLAERLGLGSEVRQALESSFAQWNGKGVPEGLGGEAIPMSVRVGTLADLVEVAFREHGGDGAIEIATTWKGISLDPELARRGLRAPRDRPRVAHEPGRLQVRVVGDQLQSLVDLVGPQRSVRGSRQHDVARRVAVDRGKDLRCRRAPGVGELA